MAERFPYGPLPCTANEFVDSVAINCAMAASVAEVRNDLPGLNAYDIEQD